MELDLHLFNVTTVDHHFDYSATIMHYLCVWTILPVVRPSLVGWRGGHVIFNCTNFECAVHMKAEQTQMGLTLKNWKDHGPALTKSQALTVRLTVQHDGQLALNFHHLAETSGRKGEKYTHTTLAPHTPPSTQVLYACGSVRKPSFEIKFRFLTASFDTFISILTIHSNLRVILLLIWKYMLIMLQEIKWLEH